MFQIEINVTIQEIAHSEKGFQKMKNGSPAKDTKRAVLQLLSLTCLQDQKQILCFFTHDTDISQTTNTSKNRKWYMSYILLHAIMLQIRTMGKNLCDQHHRIHRDVPLPCLALG